MKVEKISNLENFFKVVDSCVGKVELITGEGDRLNLKSKLAQYVSMANIFSNSDVLEKDKMQGVFHGENTLFLKVGI